MPFLCNHQNDQKSNINAKCSLNLFAVSPLGTTQKALQKSKAFNFNSLFCLNL
jgi:hypothetical protein